MKEFQDGQKFVLGKPAKTRMPGSEFVGMPYTFTATELTRKNIKTADDFFRLNPFNIMPGIQITIYELDPQTGAFRYFDTGKFQPKKKATIPAPGLPKHLQAPVAPITSVVLLGDGSVAPIQPDRAQTTNKGAAAVPMATSSTEQIQRHNQQAQTLQANVLDVLKEELTRKNDLIERMQAEINNLNVALLNANNMRVTAEAELQKMKDLEALRVSHEKKIEEKLMKEFQDDVRAEAKKISASKGGLGDGLDSFLANPLVQTAAAALIGKFMGGDTPAPAPAAPAAPAPVPIIQPADVSIEGQLQRQGQQPVQGQQVPQQPQAPQPPQAAVVHMGNNGAFGTSPNANFGRPAGGRS